ncbi:MAG TPA: hypothetical protein VFX31_05365 [Ktedonobacterales bacterium]|nr:hypothetical protein [Ktedonobacterales bacterium]
MRLEVGWVDDATVGATEQDNACQTGYNVVARASWRPLAVATMS